MKIDCKSRKIRWGWALLWGFISGAVGTFVVVWGLIGYRALSGVVQ